MRQKFIVLCKIVQTAKSQLFFRRFPFRTLSIAVPSTILLSLGTLAGCKSISSVRSNDTETASEVPEFTTLPTISENPNPKVPLAAVLQFEASEPVETTIQVSDGEHEWNLKFDETHDSTEGLPVIGMRPDRTHSIKVIIRDADGNEISTQESLEFTTPAITYNTETFPPLDVRTSQPEKMEPGVTMLSVRRNKPVLGKKEIRSFNQGFGMLLAVDAAGEPVWFYQQDSRISDFELLDNGNIAYLTQDYRLIEIDLLGNTVNTWWATGRPQGETKGIPITTDTLHHDINQLTDGNLVVLGTEQRTIENYYTSETDPNAPRATQQVMGDLIIEFEKDGTVVWDWNSFDFLDPFRIGYETFKGYWNRRGFPNTVDWTHANNLVYDDKDNSLLLSSRYLSAIMKIDRETGELIWILGDPAGWSEKLQDKIFTLEGEASGKTRWFYHQHSPEPSHNGTVLLFDNGSYQAFPFEPPAEPAQTYSRAVEYEIDEANRRIKQVWTSEIPGEEKVISFAMGDVDALPNTDNILLSEGWLLPNDKVAELTWETIPDAAAWTRIREYAHTSPPEVLWEVVMNNGSDEDSLGWLLFASERIQLPFLQP